MSTTNDTTHQKEISNRDKLKKLLNILNDDNEIEEKFNDKKITSKQDIYVKDKLIELSNFYGEKIKTTFLNSVNNNYDSSNFYFHGYNFSNWSSLQDSNNDNNDIYFNLIHFIQYLKKENIISNSVIFEISKTIRNNNINVKFTNLTIPNKCSFIGNKLSDFINDKNNTHDNNDVSIINNLLNKKILHFQIKDGITTIVFDN
jgi:hypothetical protein